MVLIALLEFFLGLIKAIDFPISMVLIVFILRKGLLAFLENSPKAIISLAQTHIAQKMGKWTIARSPSLGGYDGFNK